MESFCPEHPARKWKEMIHPASLILRCLILRYLSSEATGLPFRASGSSLPSHPREEFCRKQESYRETAPCCGSIKRQRNKGALLSIVSGWGSGGRLGASRSQSSLPAAAVGAEGAVEEGDSLAWLGLS